MAGYHLATTIATPAAYAYLPFAFANLGWAGGLVLLIMGIAVTCKPRPTLCLVTCTCAVSEVFAAMAVFRGFLVPDTSRLSDQPGLLIYLHFNGTLKSDCLSNCRVGYTSLLISSLHEFNGVRYVR